jgi:hypothetical protein
VPELEQRLQEQRLELELPRQQVLLLEPLLEPVGSGVRQTYG